MEVQENPNANKFYDFTKQKGIKFALEMANGPPSCSITDAPQSQLNRSNE
jgi:hypothetical protein